MFSIVEQMPEVRLYKAATEFVFNCMPGQKSIVSSSIISAIDGNYGDHHATSRTRNSKLWINPLMPVYWCFKLSAVAERILYREAMKGTDKYSDVNGVIKEFRESCQTIRPRQEIPI
jgi:hypothetical protein